MKTNVKVDKLTCVKVAGKELLKGFGNAAKAIKEIFKKPSDQRFSYVSQAVHKERFPEIDWFSETKWEDFDECYNFDMRALPLWDDFKMDSYYSKEKGTYTTFSGNDMTPVVNGDVVLDFTGYRLSLNGKLEGNIDIARIRFGLDSILPEDTLIVTTYMNKYGNAAYEIIHLDKLLAYKTGMSIDKIQNVDYMRYSGKLLQPMVPIPEELRNMSNENFKAMVERVKLNCIHKNWINENIANPANNMANRMYFWVLDKKFSNNTES